MDNRGVENRGHVMSITYLQLHNYITYLQLHTWKHSNYTGVGSETCT